MLNDLPNVEFETVWLGDENRAYSQLAVCFLEMIILYDLKRFSSPNTYFEYFE